MAPKISYPGVYIQEVPSGIKKIRAAPTSVAGMIGSFSKGPIYKARRVKNWKEFTQIFGILNNNHLASYSIKQFFGNGGASLWIVRTDNQRTPTAPALLQGLEVLAQVEVLNILVIPETQQLESQEASKVFRAAIAVAEQHRAMYILDAPLQKDSRITTSTIRSWVSRQRVIRHSNVALYTPNVRVRVSANAKRTMLIPASGTIAGLWARIDKLKGVWKAPAGTEATLQNVQSLERRITNQDIESLTNQGVNALRLLPSNQIVSWGARTLSTNPEWKYVPVRRLALFIESSLQQGTQWVVFEPNDEPLWASIRQSVGDFLNGLFRKGAFQGLRPEDAYFVRCGRDTISANDRQRGKVNIVVGFAPLKPAEFVILTIRHQSQALVKN